MKARGPDNTHPIGHDTDILWTHQLKEQAAHHVYNACGIISKFDASRVGWVGYIFIQDSTQSFPQLTLRIQESMSSLMTLRAYLYGESPN